MPWATKAKKLAYDTAYNAKPEQVKNRTSRNAARRKLVKAGVDVRGKDVDHRNGNPRSNGRSNLRAMSPSKNRSKK